MRTILHVRHRLQHLKSVGKAQRLAYQFPISEHNQKSWKIIHFQTVQSFTRYATANPSNGFRCSLNHAHQAEKINYLFVAFATPCTIKCTCQTSGNDNRILSPKCTSHHLFNIELQESFENALKTMCNGICVWRWQSQLVELTYADYRCCGHWHQGGWRQCPLVTK